MGDDFSYLQYVPDWFVTKEWVQMRYDNSEYCDDEDNFFKWYKVYKKRKVKKASIKEEFNAYCLASIKVLGLVHVRRWKKRDRKIMG